MEPISNFSDRLKRLFPVLALITLLLGLGAERAFADQLYLATAGSAGAGSLYLIDPATGAILQTIGPLVDAGGNAYGVSGLAFQPGTSVLYGGTSNGSPTAPGHLVAINPATARVTDIGSFTNGQMSDITFDPTTGILYGVHAAGDHWLYTINLATGAATKVGVGISAAFGGGGLATNSAGAMFVTPDGSTNPNPTLQTVDKITGIETLVAALTGGPLPHIISALAFTSGTLFGIQTTDGLSFPNPTITHLVKINPATGAVTDVGLTVPNADAIAFLPQIYQVRYAANLDLQDAVVNLTNTGANNAANICVNTYTFAYDEQLISCCTCEITRNSLWSLSANSDLIANTLTPLGDIARRGIIIKLVATEVDGGCVNQLVNPVANLTPALAAWGTSIHRVGPGFGGLGNPATTFNAETPFTSSTLSNAERNIMTSFCGFIRSNGSGVGICDSCRGLGPNLPDTNNTNNKGLGGDRQ